MGVNALTALARAATGLENTPPEGSPCINDQKLLKEVFAEINKIIFDRLDSEDKFDLSDVSEDVEEYIRTKCCLEDLDDYDYNTQLLSIVIELSKLMDEDPSINKDSIEYKLVKRVLVNIYDRTYEKIHGNDVSDPKNRQAAWLPKPRVYQNYDVNTGTTWNGFNAGVDVNQTTNSFYSGYRGELFDFDSKYFVTRMRYGAGSLLFDSALQEDVSVLLIPSFSVMAGGKISFFDLLHLRAALQTSAMFYMGRNYSPGGLVPIDGGVGIGINIYNGWQAWVSMMLEYAVEPVDVQDTESFGLPYDHTTEMASINSPDNRFQIRAGRQVWQWGSTIFGGVSFTFPKVVGDLSMKVAVEGLWNLESEFAVYPPAVFGTIDLFYEPAEDLGVYASVGGNFKEYNKPSVWFTTPYWSGVDDSHDVEIVATETQKRLNALQRMDTIEPIYSDGDIAYSATSYDSCLSLGHDGCDGSALVFGDEYWTCTDLGNGTMECARPLWDSDAEGNSYSFATEHVIVEDTGTDVFDVVTQGQAHKLEMGKVWFEFTDPVLKLLDSSKTYGEFAEGLQGMTFEEKLSALHFAAYLLNTTYNLTGTVKTIKKVDRIGQEDLYKTIRSAAFDEITEKTSVCRGFAKFITRLASDIGLSATAAILSTTSEAHVISLVSEGDGEPFHVVNFGKYDVSINALTVTDAIWNYIYAVNSDLNVNEVEGHGMYTEPIIVNLYDSNGRYGGRVEFPLKNLIDKEIGVDAGAAEFINGGN